MNNIIRFESVWKTYHDKNNEEVALREFDLDIGKGEFVSIVGPSGCGKSTVLNLLAGFISCTKGFVSHFGQTVDKPDGNRAVVFQEDAVFPWLTVRQNIGYGPKVNKRTQEERIKLEMKYLDIVGLTSYEDYYPKQLSGGMKKRVDLARAYANNPSTLLMDEPFGSLDAITREDMQIKLQSLMNIDKKTVLFITHDVSEAILLSDKVAVMSKSPGRVLEIVPIDFERPRQANLKNHQSFILKLKIIEKILSSGKSDGRK